MNGNQGGFRVVDIPSDATAVEMEGLLNALTDQGYSLRPISYSWPNAGARAIFKVPAKPVAGKWIRELARNMAAMAEEARL